MKGKVLSTKTALWATFNSVGQILQQPMCASGFKDEVFLKKKK